MRLLYRLKDYRFRIDDREWNVVVCRSCGLGYLNPRPTRLESQRYYPPGYYSMREKRLDLYRRQANYVPKGAGRLLEIGAAQGEFLARMRDRGWEVVGIEPSEHPDNPHNLPIHRASFPEECHLDPSSFAAITAWAVFEHLHDPGGAFEACRRLPRPGGRLIIQVPNLRSIQSRWARQEDVPRHLYFFSERTLRAYGERAGLVLDKIVHTTDLFGGSGRGILRLALVRSLGRSIDDYFEMYSVGRRERFRRWPATAVFCTGVGLLERLILSDRLVRAARISGQIIAYFHKPSDGVGISGSEQVSVA
jgi:SAM-dependent methyltransferase